MTKQELISKLAETMALPKTKIGEIVDSLFVVIEEATKADGKVRIGKHIFKKVERAARKGHNPRTGETIDIPASTSIVYRLKI